MTAFPPCGREDSVRGTQLWGMGFGSRLWGQRDCTPGGRESCLAERAHVCVALGFWEFAVQNFTSEKYRE